MQCVSARSGIACDNIVASRLIVAPVVNLPVSSVHVTSLPSEAKPKTTSVAALGTQGRA
jgi:hypothetical protein